MVKVIERTHNTPGGKYIYGIINSNKELSLRPFPVGNIREAKQGNQISNGVHAISYQDISAVVSDSKTVDYTNMPKEVLVRWLVNHQEVIERIMSQGYAIIPVRLGTFAVDENEVKDILHRGYSLIKDIEEKISDKIEIDVAVTWSDFSLALKEVSEEKEIKEFKEKLLANPKEVTIDEQMKVGVMVKKVLDKKREKYAQEIQNALKTISQDFKAHELMDDKMIINTAFLINRDEQKDFDRKIEKLNTEFAEKLNFRCIGPLPVYSFYTLEIKKIPFEEIDWARKRLGLSDFASKEEIKKAYKAKAFSSHPDRNLDASDIEREFDDVTKAYEVLIDYGNACEQMTHGRMYSFKEEKCKGNAILVKVRG